MEYNTLCFDLENNKFSLVRRTATRADGKGEKIDP